MYCSANSITEDQNLYRCEPWVKIQHRVSLFSVSVRSYAKTEQYTLSFSLYGTPSRQVWLNYSSQSKCQQKQKQKCACTSPTSQRATKATVAKLSKEQDLK